MSIKTPNYIAILRDEQRKNISVTRRASLDASEGPVQRIANDRLSSHGTLVYNANGFATAQGGPITHYSGTWMDAIQDRQTTNNFEVTRSRSRTGTFVFDRVVANVGYRPDNRIHAELQVHECHATMPE